MVAANRHETGKFALAAGVWLKRNRVVAGDFAEPSGELVDHLQIAASVVGWSERVNVAELWPGDGLHLGCRIQLHGARSQRNHAAVERVVVVGQTLEVSQHRGFAVVRVEHLVG